MIIIIITTKGPISIKISARVFLNFSLFDSFLLIKTFSCISSSYMHINFCPGFLEYLTQRREGVRSGMIEMKEIKSLLSWPRPTKISVTAPHAPCSQCSQSLLNWSSITTKTLQPSPAQPSPAQPLLAGISQSVSHVREHWQTAVHWGTESHCLTVWDIVSFTMDSRANLYKHVLLLLLVLTLRRIRIETSVCNWDILQLHLQLLCWTLYYLYILTHTWLADCLWDLRYRIMWTVGS